MRAAIGVLALWSVVAMGCGDAAVDESTARGADPRAAAPDDDEIPLRSPEVLARYAAGDTTGISPAQPAAVAAGESPTP
jgi:hypothetical protein